MLSELTGTDGAKTHTHTAKLMISTPQLSLLSNASVKLRLPSDDSGRGCEPRPFLSFTLLRSEISF